jgi:hypothetical protein
MTTAGGTSDSSEPSVSLPKLNTLAIVAIVLVAVAAMGIAVGSRSWSWGIFFGGPLVLAIPAVGAGHAALQQINVRRERGAILAYVALGICYLFATYALVSSVLTGIVYLHQ